MKLPAPSANAVAYTQAYGERQPDATSLPVTGVRWISVAALLGMGKPVRSRRPDESQ
jgi:hypothetical protein